MIETPQSLGLENSTVRIHEFKDTEEIRFLSKSNVKYCFYYTFNVLTLGILILFFHWLELHVYLYNTEEDFEHATHILVITKEDKWIIIPIEKGTFDILPINEEDKVDPKSKRNSLLQDIEEQNEDSPSMKDSNKLAKFLEKKEQLTDSGVESVGNVLSELLDRSRAGRPAKGDSIEDQKDLLNPNNKLLINSHGMITKRYINFVNRKYFYDESTNTFLPLETVFETHVLRKPALIQKIYRYGNTEKSRETLLKTFNKNELYIEQNAWIYDVITSLFDPMNFGILLLVIICFICNKLAEAIGKPLAHHNCKILPSTLSSSSSF